MSQKAYITATRFGFLIETRLRKTLCILIMLRIFGTCFKPPPHVESRVRKFIEGSNPGHLYLIKEREFIKTNENIYKIGKTKNIKNRMPSYPKDSRVYVIYYCASDIHKVEKELIKEFDKLFKKRTDIGNEYYETDKDIVYHFFQTMFSLK